MTAEQEIIVRKLGFTLKDMLPNFRGSIEFNLAPREKRVKVSVREYNEYERKSV